MKKKENRLVAVMIGGVLLLLGAGLWWSYLDAEPVLNRPPAQLPVPNAYDFYVEAVTMHAAIKAATPGSDAVDPVTDSSFNSDWTPQEIVTRYPTSSKVRWIKTNAAVLQTLRKGFAFNYWEPQPDALQQTPVTKMPHYEQFRNLARLLVIESHSCAERGDWTGAGRSILDVFHLSYDVRCGGPLSAAAEAGAIGAIGRREMLTILPHLNASSARTGAREIEMLEVKRFSFDRTVEQEKWFTQAELKQFMRRRDWRIEIMPGANLSWPDAMRAQFQSKRGAMDDFTHYMDALSIEAKRPYRRRQLPASAGDPLLAAIIPNWERGFWNDARHQTGNAVLMLQLAIRAYKLEHRCLPGTLDVLIPRYIKKVPADPFGSGEALRYRRLDKTYLLYSIGSDGKDDAGRSIESGIAAQTSDRQHLMLPDSQGDYVAGINW